MADVLIESQTDGTLLLLIPEGEFLAGDPKFPVRLPAFYLALHPVTNAQYARHARETGRHRDWKAAAGPEHPAVNLSWEDAQGYCRWAGLRLPTELEWEKGARGLYGREYPWGPQWDPAKCRNGTNRGGEQTCGVWNYEAGASPWGLYQMAGNVWEWCEDWYDSGAYARYKKGDLKPPGTGGARVVRGGSWNDGNAGHFRCAARRSTSPTARRAPGAAAAGSGAPGLYDYPLLFCSLTLCLRRAFRAAGRKFLRLYARRIAGDHEGL